MTKHYLFSCVLRSNKGYSARPFHTPVKSLKTSADGGEQIHDFHLTSLFPDTALLPCYIFVKL